jgi:hypothetical protein
MNELTNLRTKADLWWQERRGLIHGLFKNPLFLILGVRISQPDAQSVNLRLPWGKPQRLLASEIPLSLVLGCAEMALQLHMRQFAVFAPVQASVTSAEVTLPKVLNQPLELKLKSTWPEWEELRLELAKVKELDREYNIPLWTTDARTLGNVKIHVRLKTGTYLPPGPTQS